MRKKEKKGIGCGGIIIIIIGLAILAALIVLITDKDDNKNNSESSNNSYFADENITDSFDNSIISKSEDDIESKATDDKNDLKIGSDEEKDSKSEKTDLIRPEFKEAIDSYVEFFDEYAEFMKKYNAVGENFWKNEYAGWIYAGLIAAIGLFSLIAVIKAIRKKPIGIIISTIFTVITVAIFNWDLSARHVVQNENYVWGVAHYCYYIIPVIIIVGSIWLFIKKRQLNKDISNSPLQS